VVVTFFVAAQVAGVAAGLALVQALVGRRSAMPRDEILLLSRRNGCALVAAALTMFSAGAALPGRGSALLLLAGPAVVCVALISLCRTRSLARRLDGPAGLAVRPPLEDLASLSRLRIPALDSRRLLAATACVAAAAAFLRDHGEHATAGQALVTAGIEAAAVVACFAVLGRPLGLWGRRMP
jgi:hypothetical protein